MAAGEFDEVGWAQDFNLEATRRLAGAVDIAYLRHMAPVWRDELEQLEADVVNGKVAEAYMSVFILTRLHDILDRLQYAA